jgi:hypothetical protein
VVDVVAAVILRYAHRGQLVKRTEVERWCELAQARAGDDWLELSDESRLSAVIEARSWKETA